MRTPQKLKNKIVIVAAITLLVLLSSIVSTLSQPSFSSQNLARNITNTPRLEFEFFGGFGGIQDDIDNVIESCTTVLNTFDSTIQTHTETVRNYIQTVDTYQEELAKTSEMIINDTSGLIEAKINEISDSIQASVVDSIRTVGWAVLIGELIGTGGVTALATYLVVRRINKQLKGQINELNKTITELQRTVKDSVSITAMEVRREINSDDTRAV